MRGLFCFVLFFQYWGLNSGPHAFILYSLSHTFSPFCFGCFGDKGLTFYPGRPRPILILFYAFHCYWDDKGTSLCPAFSHWDRVMQTCFAQGVLDLRSSGFQSPSVAWDSRCIIPLPVIGWDGIWWIPAQADLKPRSPWFQPPK
jgi:hypothetical protein